MRKLLVLWLVITPSVIWAQSRVVAECTVQYTIQVNNENSTDQETVNLLKATTKTVYIKANDSRVDLISPTFQQSVIFDKNTGEAVILRELGANKFMTKLDAKAWEAQHAKFADMEVSLVNETKKILGFDCKKAVLQLKNGTSFTVYYATAIVPSVKEFEYQFRNIPGFVLEYEAQEGKGEKITYTAIKINLNPVQASRFDIPTSGYRLLN
jgi:GLPGLI family protein